jgi:membrane associated rhomboid family serine protease
MFPIRDHEPSARFPFLTLGLIGLNVWVFFLELTSPDLEGFIRTWALVPNTLDIADPASLAPVLTSQFLHGGFAHILFNMWYLWIFGDNVEGHFGHGKFLLFYLTSGSIAALSQLFFLLGSDIPMLGASGAVAGVLGAYLALFPHHRVDALVPLGFFLARTTLPAGAVLFFWFITQLFNGTASLAAVGAHTGGIAYAAHIGGFVFGWGIAKLLRKPSSSPWVVP